MISVPMICPVNPYILSSSKIIICCRCGESAYAVVSVRDRASACERCGDRAVVLIVGIEYKQVSRYSLRSRLCQDKRSCNEAYSALQAGIGSTYECADF